LVFGCCWLLVVGFWFLVFGFEKRDRLVVMGLRISLSKVHGQIVRFFREWMADFFISLPNVL